MRKLLFFILLLFSINSFGQNNSFFKTFNGIFQDVATDIVQTPDTGFVITGSTRGLGGANGISNVYLIKTNKYGDTLWTKNFGGANWSGGSSLQQTQDGGYIIVGGYQGTQNNCVYLIKTDANGDSTWTRCLGNGQDNCVGNCVQQTLDGGYIIVGFIYSANNNLIYLLRTDSNGDTLWTRSISAGLQENIGNKILLTSDGGFFITGYKRTTSGSYWGDILFIKTDSTGIPAWIKSYPDCQGNSCINLSNSGFMAAGTTINGDMKLYRINNIGDTLWTKTVSGYTGASIINTVDGGYAITGKKYQNTFPHPEFGDISLIKTDSSGIIEYVKIFGDSLDDGGVSIKQTFDGGFAIAGYYDYGSQGVAPDVWGEDMGCYLKTNQSGDITKIKEYSSLNENQIIVFPNPFSTSCTIQFQNFSNEIFSLSIYSSYGQLVFQKTNIANGQLEIQKGDLPSGVYFIQLQNEHSVIHSKKIIIE